MAVAVVAKAARGAKVEHKTVFVEALDADIDEQVVSLVESINALGFKTVSSCQGDPGILGMGGSTGHVVFVDGNQRFERDDLSKFTFDLLRSFVAHMDDDVALSIHLSEQTGYAGWMRFRNEALEEISKRLGVYCEMHHK